MTHQYRIMPEGIVQGGTLEYTLNLPLKEVRYELHLLAQKWMFKKRIDEVGFQDINPDLLLSAQFSKVGYDFHFANIRGTITEVDHSIATASIMVDGVSAIGVARFSLSEAHVVLIDLDARGSYGPISFHLIVRGA